MLDYLVVGAGPFGATFARTMTDRGAKVLVVDRRDHLAGNCHTPRDEGGTLIHAYGPHAFHTDDERVWALVNKFGAFNGFQLRVKADASADGTGPLYSFPPNLETYNQLWGSRTWAQAEARIAATREAGDEGSVEGWCLANVGREVYELFIRGYTRKQWGGRDPRDLPASIVRRLKFRRTHDGRHSHSRHHGVPVHGYTELFASMLEGVEVRTGVDYLADRRLLDRLARCVVYTGRPDELFGYRLGPLDYLSLSFVHTQHATDHQGTAVVNNTHADVPHTRTSEHRHFAMDPAGPGQTSPVTVETPAPYTPAAEPYYPVVDEANAALYALYAGEAARAGVLLGGRLGSFRYIDTDRAIAEALALADSRSR